jgi:hypothetical protein
MGRLLTLRKVQSREVRLGGLLSAGRRATRWAKRVQLAVDKPLICAEWDLGRPAILSQSRLYSLEPVGIGRPETECLPATSAAPPRRTASACALS